jgi:tRNA (guanine-N7-)-methyltransferase
LGKNKLKRFAELETMERVFQPGMREPEANFFLKNKWNELVFNNQNPIVVELGCGRGEYTTSLAQMYPGSNFIGIDKKGARLWKGAKTANEDKILNAAFLRIPIEQLDYYFAPGEITEIWITFPDPQPQKTRENTRMTSPRFLEMYKSMLPPNGTVHLKTDNAALFDYTLEKVKELNVNIIAATHDLYSEHYTDDVLSITTTYEKRYLSEGVKICYLKFSF